MNTIDGVRHREVRHPSDDDQWLQVHRRSLSPAAAAALTASANFNLKFPSPPTETKAETHYTSHSSPFMPLLSNYISVPVVVRAH